MFYKIWEIYQQSRCHKVNQKKRKEKKNRGHKVDEAKSTHNLNSSVCISIHFPPQSLYLSSYRQKNMDVNCIHTPMDFLFLFALFLPSIFYCDSL